MSENTWITITIIFNLQVKQPDGETEHHDASASLDSTEYLGTPNMSSSNKSEASTDDKIMSPLKTSVSEVEKLVRAGEF